VDPQSASAIDDAFHGLESASGTDRLPFAQKVVDLGDGAFGALRARLFAAPPSAVTVDSLHKVLAAIGASMPDASGHFSEAPQDPSKPPLDWLDALAKLPDPADAASVDSAMETVALLRAIAGTQDDQAAETLVDFAFLEDQGLFRDECGRILRSMGGPALPGLLRVELERTSRPSTNADDKALWDREARYAAYELDRMDRASAFKALNQPDDGLRIAVLQVFGDSKDSDAVSAVLALCDDESPGVRTKARWAWQQYVDGHPAKPPMRKLKLPGGTFSDKEQPVYLTYHELADQAIRDELKNETGQEPLDTAALDDMTQQLFAFYDERRAAQWEDLYKQGLQSQTSGDLPGMAQRFDWILVHDPFFPDRAGMAAGYAAYGAQLETASSWAQAAAEYHRAADVAPSDPQATTRAGEALRCDAQAAQASGASTSEVLRMLNQAVATDPANTVAADEIRSLEKEPPSHRLVLAGAGILAGLLIVAGLVLVRRR
jgi:hypothetical protein